MAKSCRSNDQARSVIGAGPKGVESPQQRGVQIAPAASESCGVAFRRDPCHASSASMLPLLLLLVTSGGGGGRPAGDPCQETDSARRRDSLAQLAGRVQLLPGFMPVLWSNDYGGVTVGLRARAMCRRDVERGLFVASAATRGGATSSISLYGRWTNPPLLGSDARRGATSLAAWSIEGRTGAALSLDRAPDHHFGIVALWMATTNVGYLDRRRWDNAGSIEISPSLSTAVRRGETVRRASVVARIGTVYRQTTVDPGSPYHYEAFTRLSGEVSVRTPVPRATTFGARVFAGAYLGPSNPVRQLRIAVAGADPYETFTNPLLRSRGALLVRPDFHYHAPGGGNLRGFRNDLGGRWAVGVNLELVRRVLRRETGLLREAALEGFVDLGVVDTLAVPSAARGRWYTTLYDGGLGLVTQHQLKDVAWTMRFEVPLAVNRWDRAADFRPNSTQFALRWQVSLAPSF